MKTLNKISFTHQHSCWLSVISFLTLLLLSSCGGSSSDDPAFTPQNTLSGKVFVLGSQVEANGDLVMYVSGTDLQGAPLAVADLQTASVTVDSGRYTKENPVAELDIMPVDISENILSLSLLTDYSFSTGDEVKDVATIYTKILNNLPKMYEAQVITFSDLPELKLDWSEDLTAIEGAVATSHSAWRNGTALYDSMGAALEGNGSIITKGLIGQCRPAHLLAVFTDGVQNPDDSSVYTKDMLTLIINDDQTVVVMLGTSTADPAVLLSLAGNKGAVVQTTNASQLAAEVDNWSAALKNMVKITLKYAAHTAAGGFVDETISIAIGSQNTTVVNPKDATACP